MKKSIHSESPATTKKAARELASSIKANGPRKRALVIALEGELGAGKTTFAQALAAALGVKGHVSSPTFLILKSYPLPKGKIFHHIDCYRISSRKELSLLGFADILKDPNNLVSLSGQTR